ncbi:hypothetical protein [Clostridium sporogenes]|uniref:hypothetical protein n=1 Tax=Clostridium sporogenes TaxID=1509 RepID=UPI00024BA38D|nr:hypothetical protein [Clostridium sporogenes]EHN15629.1 hypothetical protein IYC_07750 [Clostridium sporogenes PA 3679]MCW6108677.1 hypothetical protein [Clostridium sporogenes]MDU4598428.1 hypothetical protein [Clostridium sporogenes]NFF68175.1 hypothetical protein [Clostridium sporogenes]NFG00602.1 hypothetical protein [Clostridium sporogenes]
MFKNKLIYDSLTLSLFVFIFYLLARLTTDVPTKLSPTIILIFLFLIELLVNLSVKKINYKIAKSIYVLIYGCISFGLSMFLILFDFINIPIFIAFILLILSGTVFALSFYTFKNKYFHKRNS